MMSLCSTCSSSLPPSNKLTSLDIFTTPCCQRPICPSCIDANPRLLRYNPCLACLGGVGVVRSPKYATATRKNVDGALRDVDTFVLGDDDASDDDDPSAPDILNPSQTTPAIFLEATRPLEKFEAATPNTLPAPAAEEISSQLVSADSSEVESPLKYYISSSDTLQGIVLRYGLNGHELCKLNNLPASTLRTTPHLLHTRRFLILPPSTRKSGITIDTETPDQVRSREISHMKERAEKRLQTITKEVDWRVAKAYVSLADDSQDEADEVDDWERKRKETGNSARRVGGPSNLEERAVRKYFDDIEWEESQLGSSVSSGWHTKTNTGGWKWRPWKV